MMPFLKRRREVGVPEEAGVGSEGLGPLTKLKDKKSGGSVQIAHDSPLLVSLKQKEKRGRCRVLSRTPAPFFARET